MVDAPVTRRPPAPPSRSTRWAVAGILLVVLALTVGWSLADGALDDDEPVRDNTELVLGPGDDTLVLRVVGEGWQLSKAGSDTGSGLSLSRDGVDFTASYVAVPLTTTADAGELWPGLRRIQSAVDSDSVLGPPTTATSAGGAPGATGTLRRDGRAGRAAVWVSPGQDYAVEITVLAEPDADPGALSDGLAQSREVAFPGAVL
ncbi:hypothetical protein [Streptomyces liangshanensis]|uniref:Uncharacterized protein n=1 Tax=Streptomyces liangshanensis TaxID=2717324 RepID=A0A6G9GS88_9ACTN|nr:hypothetical protein [Streptomyces liangshanensis]QIQ01112.1 hypothetical protein HA039_01295 [Streptomyces liangshanensis]